MKKVIAAVCSALLVVVMAFALTGCDVAGNKYVYEGYSVKYNDDNLSETAKKAIDLAVDLVLTPMKPVTYEFDDEGKVSVSGAPKVEYKKDGNTVTVLGVDLKISGSKLKAEVKNEEKGFSLTVTYKKA